MAAPEGDLIIDKEFTTDDKEEHYTDNNIRGITVQPAAGGDLRRSAV